jgi:hypothetical protein
VTSLSKALLEQVFQGESFLKNYPQISRLLRIARMIIISVGE